MFSIIRGGCFSRHSSDFKMERPGGLPYYVLLIIKSYCELYIDGKQQLCKPDSVLIIKPDTPYSYHNPNGEYIDDWLHFSCTDKDIEFLDYNIFNKSFNITNTRLLTTYIQQLLWEHNFCESEFKDYYVDSVFKILLQHICDDFKKDTKKDYNPYKYKFQRIRLDIQATPYKKYTAGEIAESLGISASYFQYLYKVIFDISFKTDIINMRIDYSKELITSTVLPLEQVAYACGYSNEVHFYRQFLAKTGMTPGEYRKIYSK